jgi:hypothetical protein
MQGGSFNTQAVKNASNSVWKSRASMRSMGAMRIMRPMLRGCCA